MVHLAEKPFLNQLAGLLEMRPTPLLAAYLHNLSGSPVRIKHLLSAGKRIRNRLLDIHILTRCDCVHQHLGMPMVGSCDQDRIHLLILQEPAVIFVALDLAGYLLNGPIEPCGIDVARGNKAVIGVFRK
jgi:hypothetical protein